MNNNRFNLIRVGRGQTLHLAYGSRAVCGANQGRKVRSSARVVDTCTAGDPRVSCARCKSSTENQAPARLEGIRALTR